jgi:hypothetical protein
LKRSDHWVDGFLRGQQIGGSRAGAVFRLVDLNSAAVWVFGHNPAAPRHLFMAGQYRGSVLATSLSGHLAAGFVRTIRQASSSIPITECDCVRNYGAPDPPIGAAGGFPAAHQLAAQIRPFGAVLQARPTAASR